MNKELISYVALFIAGAAVGLAIAVWFDLDDKAKEDISAKTAVVISALDRNTSDALIKDREDIENEKPFDFSFLGNR